MTLEVKKKHKKVYEIVCNVSLHVPSEPDNRFSCKMIAASFTCVKLFVIFVQVNSEFCKVFKDVSHEFYPLRHCQRSNKSTIAVTNVNSLEECADFARNQRGLAFNYSPVERRKENLYQNKTTVDLVELYSCEALKCPEHSNFSSMVNDTRYDYYSLYTHPPRECE